MISEKCQWCHDWGIFPCDDAVPCCPFDEKFDKLVRESHLRLDNISFEP